MTRLLKATLFAAAILFWGPAAATPVKIGLVTDPRWGEILVNEWTWALRGGGSDVALLSPRDIESPSPDMALLIIDSVALNRNSIRPIEDWVRRGGTLLYADAASALLESDADGRVRILEDLIAPELFGARFAGFDPALNGTYPDIVRSSPLISPLIAGDALRLGLTGSGNTVTLEAAGAEVLARSARVSPGPSAMVLKSDAPTIMTQKLDRGRVLFLSFSPGRVAACHPQLSSPKNTLDCSGAGTAHALMRWVTSNLLWEEHHLQIPLLWDAPGDRPHGFMVTGDVHGSEELQYAYRMGKIAADYGLPVSLYFVGKDASEAPEDLIRLRQLKNVEISTHSLRGRGYTFKKFKWFGGLGLFWDLRKAEAVMDLPHFPEGRAWLKSTRNHSWASDAVAWRAMHRAGVGLVFDHVADTLQQRFPYMAPPAWYQDDERRRIFVPLFERNIATTAANFHLPPDVDRDMATLASAQPEPCCVPVSYATYTGYVHRWHALFDRLATMGGLSEVWLWHPFHVNRKNGFSDYERTLEAVKQEPSITFVRADVAAGWRANRERHGIRLVRDDAGAIKNMDLLPPSNILVPLPPGAPAFAHTTSYWVLGKLSVEGWMTREWTDPFGRTVTVLVHPLAGTKP